MRLYWHRNEKGFNFSSYCLIKEGTEYNSYNGCIMHIDIHNEYNSEARIMKEYKDSDGAYRKSITKEEWDWMFAHPEEAYMELQL